MDSRVRPLVDIVWQYHHMGHALVRSDAILVLGSHDLIVARRGAELYLDGWAPLLIVSGGLGRVTSRFWAEPEADLFAAEAIRLGVPPDRILRERESTNTGENVAFTRRLLAAHGLTPTSLILVQKPYMERRTYATFRKVWPEMPAVVTSPQVGLDEYLSQCAHESLSEDEVVSIMVGDLQRIREYPARGFQIPQDMPDEVWQAGVELVRLGFDRHLIGPVEHA